MCDITYNPEIPCRDQDLEITITDATKAGETVTVTISDGGSDEQEVDVTFDPSGIATITFHVPSSWTLVVTDLDGCPTKSAATQAC